jgi:hypothetical protein
VHRPDARAHGHGAAREPVARGAAADGSRDARGEVEGDVGGDRRHHHRKDHQPGVVAADHAVAPFPYLRATGSCSQS